ncbi:hypothetical protein BH24ACT26_BH24ACT26_07040 [soil metagenome]
MVKATIMDVLPSGGSLSDPDWWARHRAVLFLLWAHVVGILAFGLVTGAGVLHSLGAAAVVAALAAGATLVKGRRTRASIAALGMLTSSAVLVHLSGGVAEVHFHFFVMMAVITLYQDWVPFLVAIVYVVVHHALFGVIAPQAVGNQSQAQSQAWRWAVIHGIFVAASSAVGLIAGRMNERTTEELRDAQQHFQDAFDNAPMGMALVGPDGHWLETNRALSKITGYPKTELQQKTFQGLTHPEDADHDLDDMRRLIAGELAGFQSEKRYVRADGTAVPINLSATLVRDKRGAPQYFIAQIEDISERRISEAYLRRLYEGQRATVRELEEAHRLKSELFNIVSHEFKTPLAGIIGFAGLLANKNDRLSDAHREKYLETIARQAERLNRLVENLFVSARQVEPTRDAIASMEDAIEAVRAQLSDTYDDVSFDVAIAPGLRPKISQEALRLVLLNLASNAVKHSAPDTSVKVLARREGEEVVVSVMNHGEPIPTEEREQIFEPFVQSEPTGRTADGVGLGLHIVGKLVTAHGGTVDLRNGESTVTLTIRVPEAIVDQGHSPGPLDLGETGTAILSQQASS